MPDPGKSVVQRKNTTAYVANVIQNPIASGLKYFTVSDTNKIITFNVKPDLFGNNVALNIDYSDNLNDGESHAVWKIFSEGDPNDRPNARIENKWWDSLIGSDASGNTVPDLDLAVNRKYGNGLRPRQSWYVDRFDALKQVIDYANSVIKKPKFRRTRTNCYVR